MVADLVENGEVSSTYKTAKVTRPEFGTGDTEVTLKATLTTNYTEKKVTSIEKEFKFTVLEEVSAVATVLNASGSGQFAVSDGTAGIYVYAESTPVKVGEIGSYKGAKQLAQGGIAVIINE